MKRIYLALSLLLTAAVVAATAFFWSGLPERVPVHWNLAGQVDGSGPRAMLWLLGPGLMALMLLLGLVLPWLSPARFDVRRFEPTYTYLIAVLVAMFGYIDALLLAAALGVSVDMARAVPAGVFMLLILVGNPLGKVKRNFFIGIRTPWTLASERVWYATHRVAARLMVGSGVLGLLSLWMAAPHWFSLVLMVAWAGIAVGYSLACYKRLQRAGRLESI